MKIGIMSDLHGYPSQFDKAMKYFADADMILCAGDVLYHGPRNPILNGYDPAALAEKIKKCSVPILFAKGNCDSEVDEIVLELPFTSKVIVYEKENIRFIVLHGHETDEGKLHDIARIYKADVLVTGHTHVKTCEAYLDSLLINPGSVGVPKDGTASVAVFENGEMKFVDIETGAVVSKCFL